MQKNGEKKPRKTRQYQKKWRSENREKLLETQKWRAKNVDKVTQYSRNWRQKILKNTNC